MKNILVIKLVINDKLGFIISEFFELVLVLILLNIFIQFLYYYNF
jgi:hypothetical protein